MALELGALRTALLEAKVSPATASKAAEELAGYENRFDGVETRLTRIEGQLDKHFWMLATIIGGLTAIALKIFTTH